MVAIPLSCAPLITLLVICLFSLRLFTSASENFDPVLFSKLQQVAGVYKEGFGGGKQRDLERVVVVTACNHGYINHLHNFKCFADRLGIKFLVMSMDSMLHDYIEHNTTMHSYLLTEGVVGNMTTETAEFRSHQFNLITVKKLESVLMIMKFGYDVLFADADIALVQDPVPLVIYPKIDYVHSVNVHCQEQEVFSMAHHKMEGNTGFYFVRSNHRTIMLWEDDIEVSLSHLHLDDQAVFWTVIRHTQDPEIRPLGLCGKEPYNADEFGLNQLSTCFLDSCVFSAGMLSHVYEPEMTYETLKSILAARNKTMCSVHANYIKGNKNKMLRLNENGLWIATPVHITYPPEFKSENITKSNSTIDDKEGKRYNLEHAVLPHTTWGNCNEYRQY